ncbi:TPA: hypothetical protein DEQ22_01980 [Candidatus Nomurabacteria bacterium]|uniref:HD domain-containing protein n=2 Tax=Candidatus Nomuraibacteriota TaxID=1752729 RepID=A0A1F6YPS1_9BACT|nr:MAG: hypothetical protein UV13_C0004G0034 [Parcubacteria group bacterium GW2011_GWC1_42_21]KKS58155.1 MAG: hypothetical protein UV23_C0015G0026 [Candidatus Nomurabacteria bacterium GW2011_GWF1_42_40]KKT00488.1 MAG: hypothetical protein UV77_C0003G0034 [Candidatus Nomurabacteria bacterium GW2011_GWA1_43_17]KKT07832.1 MAG: hypothetical protein UV85_C0004G0032 [Candidatus Nomurabacteria bacterium GW2011_GWB1_43_19]KKT11401.1 MAG: hypothetical protein UV91_C0006G0030 [Candidatus Nomurabacteria b
MKKITEIYKEYKIMPSLQEHMFRVAAVASLICDNFTEPLPKKEIITACLLHDMGNIVKFKLDYFPELNEPEGMKYWQKVQDEYIKKYGNNDHDANNKIALEFGMGGRILELINSISFFGAPSNVLDKDFAKKIVAYADERVSPFDIVSLEERFIDLSKRYAHHSGMTSERKRFENALRDIEKQIFAKCKIKPEDITNESVAPIVVGLRNFIVK